MSTKKGLNLTLKIWRQKNNKSKGQFETYKLSDVSTDSSFLEMLDMLNEQLVNNGSEPVAFDHDCREGICGMCSLYINGRPHGPDTGITTCQLHTVSYTHLDVYKRQHQEERTLSRLKVELTQQKIIKTMATLSTDYFTTR